MANTYTLISSYTVGSGGAASITFSSIPSTYTDLCLVASLRCNSSGANGRSTYATFNSSTTNYSWRSIETNPPSGVASQALTTRVTGIATGDAATTNVFSNFSIYIPNYTSSAYKSYSVDSVMENNSTTVYNWLIAGLWSDTSVINSIALTNDNASNFVQYSTAYLYGIKNS